MFYDKIDKKTGLSIRLNVKVEMINKNDILLINA